MRIICKLSFWLSCCTIISAISVQTLYAQQGSSARGNRFGPPSIDEIFERFDSNKDGKLHKNEVPEFVQPNIFPADINGDGVVTRNELQTSRQRQQSGGRFPSNGRPQPNSSKRPERAAGNRPSPGNANPPGLRPAEDRKQIYDRKKVFLSMDRNGDQKLSAQEYNGPSKMFRELDIDGNRKLSGEEAKWMMTFSSVPAGSFIMGSDTGPADEKPAHKVRIGTFKMSTTEVTTAQFCQYLNAALKAGEITVKLSDAGGGGTRIFIPVPAYGVYGAEGAKYAEKPYIMLSPVAGLSHIKVEEHPINIPEHPLNQSWIDYVPDMKKFYVRPGFEDWPAVNIKWYGAFAFAEHYGLSLPTEAEWEYAASGGKQFEWATGNGQIGSEHANYKCFAKTPGQESIDSDLQDQWIGYRIAVGSYPPNPFGIFDLAGNVWEWNLDWYREDFYQYCIDNNITRNPVNLEGKEPPTNAKGGPREGFADSTRVTRGGSYQYHQATLKTTDRNQNHPVRGNDHWGARMVYRPASIVFNGKN